MPLSCGLLLLCGIAAIASASIVVPVTDPSVYFSTHNWAIYSSNTPPVARTSNNGAYIKLTFTGTSFALAVNCSLSPTTDFMNLLYTIDNGQLKEVSVPPVVAANMSLATGLSSGQHSLVLYIYNSLQKADRWSVASVPNSAVLTVTGFVLDDGARLAPPSVLAPNHIICYGDSISEGVEADCQPGGDLGSNGGTKTWAMALAAGLDAEVSVVAYGRLGWTVPGNGNVPPVFTPGNPDQSSWNQVLKGFPRTFNPPPKAIFILHGTNDNGNPDAPVTASSLAWLSAIRAACPSSHVFLVVPFGGFKASALSNAFQQYQATRVDPLTHYIDLGSAASIGMTHGWNPTAQACDGVHPLAYRHGQLGAMLAVAASKFM